MQLDELYMGGARYWGVEQTDKHYDGLLSHFDILLENPFLFRAVDEIMIGYRRSVYERHSIYYRVGGGIVCIMAVLKRQELHKQV